MSEPLNFTNIFQDYVDGSQKVWRHDRSKTVGASESFQCIRKTYFSKNGTPKDEGYDESWGAIRRGDLVEAHYVVPAIRAALPKGVESLYLGDDQITLVHGRLSATPDGLIVNLPRNALEHYGVEDIEGDEILLEIKSVDPRINLTEPKPIHAGQVQQQFGLMWDETNHRPNYGVILYVNASWVDDIKVFVIKRDPAIYEAAKKRADFVYESTAPAQLMPEGKLKGGSECDYCPFRKQCSMAQVGSVPTGLTQGMLMPAEEAELKVLASRERRAAAQIKTLTVEKDAAAEEIKGFLRKHGKRYAKTEDGYSINYTVVPGRKSYDYEQIVADTGIDLADYTTVGDPSERLTVKAPKE